MPMTTLEVTSAEYDREAAAPDNATLTKPLPLDDVRKEIARVVRESDDLAEDLAIAAVVRIRLEQGAGESVSLVEFIQQEGFDPADFDIE
jgi:hypothetical protein